MSKGRLEAFSDGMFGIFITIMALELKVPHGDDWHALRPLATPFLTYILSFTMLGIYWNNHHHMLLMADRVNGKILWANLHLLFWLSLVTATTAWAGESGFAAVPTAVYGIVLLGAGIAYVVLARLIIAVQGPASTLATAFGRDVKGKISLALYAIAIVLALVAPPWTAVAIYAIVALIWLVPDRRIERRLEP